MNDVYVHTLRYHYNGRGNRQSRTMFPISYGPFKDEESAWEWIRQRGITRATKLMSHPAAENLNVTYNPGFVQKEGNRHNSILRVRVQQNTMS